MLVNLLENAVKYGQSLNSSGPVAVVSARVTPTTLELKVRDFGPGLPASSKGREQELFEKFTRGQSLSLIHIFASFDFFFVPPRFSFAVSDVQYLVTFAVMLAVGLLFGQLTANLRFAVGVSHGRERRAHSLFELCLLYTSRCV